jgi:hypothetical protein
LIQTSSFQWEAMEIFCSHCSRKKKMTVNRAEEATRESLLRFSSKSFQHDVHSSSYVQKRRLRFSKSLCIEESMINYHVQKLNSDALPQGIFTICSQIWAHGIVLLFVRAHVLFISCFFTESKQKLDLIDPRGMRETIAAQVAITKCMYTYYHWKTD